MTGPNDLKATGYPSPFGFTIKAFDCVGSTNDEAKALACSGAASGTVIWAAEQSGGRGRRGRQWASPPGNLYCSILLRPPVGPAEAALLSFVTALAIAETAAECLPYPDLVHCKWPNDVLVNGHKLCGILLESEMGANALLDWLVIGTGVNVTHHPDRALLDGAYGATSLVAEGMGADIGVPQVLQAYLRNFAVWYGRWLEQGFAPIREAWLRRAMGIGQPVIVKLGDKVLNGVFADLDKDGVMLLDQGDGGEWRKITAGDVFFPSSRSSG